jgi:hypothetical protein
MPTPNLRKMRKNPTSYRKPLARRRAMRPRQIPCANGTGSPRSLKLPQDGERGKTLPE